MNKYSENGRTSLGWTERIGFGAGFGGTWLAFITVGSYLTMYMTNVALLDIAAVSSIIAVSRVFDGISDLIVGSIVDHTSSRLGRARIWLLRMCVPSAVSLMLLFWMPPHLPSFVKYIYLFIVYNAATAVCFTFMSISHFSLVSLLTPDRDEQGILGNILATARTLGILAAGFLFVKLLTFFSDDPQNPNTQRGYTLAMLVFCTVMVILNLVTVLVTKERVVSDDTSDGENGYGLRQKLAEYRFLISNRYWTIMFICNILIHIGLQLITAGGSYYALYVLGDMNHVSWMMTSMTFASFISMLVFVPFLMRRYGKSRVFIAGLILFIAGTAGFALAAPAKNPMIFFNVIKGFGYGMIGSLTVGITADIISNIKQQTGRLVAGIGNAGITAAQKLGQGLSTVIFGFALAKAGFDGALDVQPDTVITAVSVLHVWLPAVLIAVVLLIFGLKFDLEKKDGGTK